MHALGQHLLGDFYGCDPRRLDDATYLEAALLQIARDLGATVIQITFHHFSPLGVSGVIVIQESHLAIHTWPEGGYAAVDMFTCGDQIAPLSALPALQEALGASRVVHQFQLRGRYEDLPPLPDTYQAGTSPAPPVRIHRDHWFTARHDQLALSLKLQGQRLHWQQSSRQRIEVYDSLAYGRFLALDGRIVVSARDERSYHELLVHLPMHQLASPRRALVLGGGDGGALRELLRYSSLASIRVIEWDEALPSVVQRFFPELGHALLDQRVELLHAEAVAWLSASPPDAEDLIVVDLPGSIDAWPAAQRDAWLALLSPRLGSQGLLVLAGPDPRQAPEHFQAWVQSLRSHFATGTTAIALLSLPTYPGGQLSLLLASAQPLDFAVPAVAHDLPDCQVYNPAIHQAAFAYPNDIQRMLDQCPPQEKP
jgi:spermidine synthase